MRRWLRADIPILRRVANLMIQIPEVQGWSPECHLCFSPVERERVFSVLCIWRFSQSPVSTLPKSVLYYILSFSEVYVVINVPEAACAAKLFLSLVGK